jgi:hypothetical protein
MGAFVDYIDSLEETLSLVDPGSKILDYFINYAYVLITNQEPISYTVNVISAIFDESMFDNLNIIYDFYPGQSLSQSKRLDFIIQ